MAKDLKQLLKQRVEKTKKVISRRFKVPILLPAQVKEIALRRKV